MRDYANGYSRIRDACLKHPPPFSSSPFFMAGFFSGDHPKVFSTSKPSRNRHPLAFCIGKAVQGFRPSLPGIERTGSDRGHIIRAGRKHCVSNGVPIARSCGRSVGPSAGRTTDLAPGRDAKAGKATDAVPGHPRSTKSPQRRRGGQHWLAGESCLAAATCRKFLSFTYNLPNFEPTIGGKDVAGRMPQYE